MRIGELLDASSGNGQEFDGPWAPVAEKLESPIDGCLWLLSHSLNIRSKLGLQGFHFGEGVEDLESTAWPSFQFDIEERGKNSPFSFGSLHREPSSQRPSGGAPERAQAGQGGASAEKAAAPAQTSAKGPAARSRRASKVTEP